MYLFLKTDRITLKTLKKDQRLNIMNEYFAKDIPTRADCETGDSELYELILSPG